MKATNSQLSVGTGGGTLLSLLGQPWLQDLTRTVALAALGATVSFLVTLLLQRWSRRR